MNIGKVEDTLIVEEMQRSYLDYAMSVIVSRALPDIRDGLKPVHRRILYAMNKTGLTAGSRFSKSAKVVGEVLGKYHPHGDSSVYDALVRMAQNFSMRYPLVKGQGNFGSIDGDPPAAMRYTEVKMDRIAEEMLRDINKETVTFSDNFDASLQEPDYLPAALPNLLLMGADGIAVGMATKIPPHNLNEVVDAIIFMIDQIKQGGRDEVEKITLTIDDLIRFVKGPDFPTAGVIFDIDEIKNAYTTGKGKIVIRAKADIEELNNGRPAVIITEVPYQVNKATLVAKIAQLVKDKKINDIADLRDESDQRGIRVVVELKRAAVPRKILNQLFKYTQMQTTFPVNMVALVDNTPQTLSLRTILEEFLKHRHDIVRKRSEFDLKENKAREHILEGLKIAVDNIDAVIETIKKARDVDDAREKLMQKFALSELQAQAILDMQLKKLAALERQKIEEELAAIRKTIAFLEDLLAHPYKIFGVVKKELLEIKEKYGDARKTKVIKGKVGEFSDEDLIPNEETLIAVTKTGYVKRLPKGTFRIQRRGGKGIIGMATKEEDQIEHLFAADTHDHVLFFTNKGRVFKLRAWDVPETSRQAKGQAIINLINIEQGEIINSILITKDFAGGKKDGFIFMATRNGVVKKSRLDDFKNIKASGLIAIRLDAGDELVWAQETNGSFDIMLVTHLGKVIRFPEKEVRELGRATRGVAGIKLSKKGDYVVAMEVFSPKEESPEDKRRKFFKDILVIMEKGLGKRTEVGAFRGQHRAGTGIKVANITDKTGPVAAALLITQEEEQLIITSEQAQVIKLPIKNIPTLTRDTQGVILMRFAKKNDRVAAATAM